MVLVIKEINLIMIFIISLLLTYAEGEIVKVIVQFSLFKSEIEISFEDDMPGRVVIEDTKKNRLYLEVGGSDFGVAYYLEDSKTFVHYVTVDGWSFTVKVKKDRVKLVFERVLIEEAEEE